MNISFFISYIWDLGLNKNMRERNKANKKVRTEQEIEKKVVILTFHKVPGKIKAPPHQRSQWRTNAFIRATYRAWGGGVGRSVGEPKAVTLAGLHPTQLPHDCVSGIPSHQRFQPIPCSFSRRLHAIREELHKVSW